MPQSTLLSVLLLAACSGSAGAESADRAQPSSQAAMLAAQAKDAQPRSAAADDDGLEKLAGRYRYAGGAGERQALEDAVDEVVEEMNLIARPIARERLLEANQIPSKLGIEVDARKVTVSFDQRRYTASIDGPAVSVVGVTGDPLKLTLRFQSETLVQKFVGKRGGRVNRIQNKGERIRMQVRVHSESLPKDLTYRLTFRREG